MMRTALTLASITVIVCAAWSAETPQVTVTGGKFNSVLPPAPEIDAVTVKTFRLDITPVTNAQFAEFVGKHPEWRRDHVARLFADQEYLAHWPQAEHADEASPDQPVTHVSWFAAGAYCEAQGKRLPMWYEWEYVAAASETEKER